MGKITEFKKMMETIAKKYHLTVKESCNRLHYYYIRNSKEWEGEKRVPSNYLLDFPIFKYNASNNTCYIPYTASEVTKDSIEEWRKYIEDMLNGFMTTRFLVQDEHNMMPLKGSFECWKKCITDGGRNALVKLEVPEDALRYQQVNNIKFRVSKAKVVGIYNSYKREMKDIKEVRPVLYDYNDFKYRLGEMVYPDSWDECEIACSNGLHAFLRFEDAIKY